MVYLTCFYTLFLFLLGFFLNIMFYISSVICVLSQKRGDHSLLSAWLLFPDSNIHLPNWSLGGWVHGGGRRVGGGQAPILGGRRKRRRRRRRGRIGTHLRRRSTRRPRPSCSPPANISTAAPPPPPSPRFSFSDKTIPTLPCDVAFAWGWPVLVTVLWRKCLFEGHPPSLSFPPSPPTTNSN